MYKNRLYGVVIPTITPMHEDGTLDVQSLEKYTEFLIGTGINCLYPNGTNGESLMLTKEERETVAQTMSDVNAKRLPIFIQCGSMTTEETASHVKHAVKIGADGVGIMTPAFFTMDEEAMFEYYSDAIKDVPTDFPIYVYNIPGCTTNDVTPTLLGRLMNTFPNVVGIKYSCPNLMRIEDYLRCCERKPDILIGCDSLFLQCLITGGVGTVTGPGAVFYKRFNRVYRQYMAGDLKGAQETQNQIVKLDRQLAGIPGIPALKTMLKQRGIIESDTCRKPLRKLTQKECDTIARVIENYDKEEENIHE
ncbi:dihydrodipicolinate synthase family protein [uncultured Succinatimonas sp.]|uniref:dihydrodipicolinate synthase family protein n=1 Tax=uncultured Succinatimonas sp. TaxID=1262973 RepID=UPI0025D5F6FE|nr:dihydrodipicolinate synthase family protein [uncultured Succinatimonas sp.]